MKRIEFERETKQIKGEFSRLLLRLQKSLEESCKVDDVVNLLINLDDEDVLKRCKSIADVFKKAAKFCSFYETKVVKLLIEELGTDQDRDNYKNYKEKFQKFCLKRVFLFPDGKSSHEVGNKLVMEMDRHIEKLPKEEKKQFQYEVSRNFEGKNPVRMLSDDQPCQAPVTSEGNAVNVAHNVTNDEALTMSTQNDASSFTAPSETTSATTPSEEASSLPSPSEGSSFSKPSEAIPKLTTSITIPSEASSFTTLTKATTPSEASSVTAVSKTPSNTTPSEASSFTSPTKATTPSEASRVIIPSNTTPSEASSVTAGSKTPTLSEASSFTSPTKATTPSVASSFSMPSNALQQKITIPIRGVNTATSTSSYTEVSR